jgi:hypothetical protein
MVSEAFKVYMMTKDGCPEKEARETPDDVFIQSYYDGDVEACHDEQSAWQMLEETTDEHGQ